VKYNPYSQNTTLYYVKITKDALAASLETPSALGR